MSREILMKVFRKSNIAKSIILVSLTLTILSAYDVSHADIKQTKGQTVYLSIYPTIVGPERQTFFFLSTILTIRNIDLHHSITVDSIKYYDSNGVQKKNILEEPVVLNPISSTSISFGERELSKRGMAGCFIITWKSTNSVIEPIIEGIMSASGRGWVNSLVFYGQVIEELK